MAPSAHARMTRAQIAEPGSLAPVLAMLTKGDTAAG